MGQKGFIMLPQILILSLLLLTAGTVFTVYHIYADAQTAENAQITALYLAKKEIAITEGQLLSHEKNFTYKINSNQKINLNNFIFTIKTTVIPDNNLKHITTIIYWKENSHEKLLSLEKTVYTND
ncbi:hypothetical protein [Pectinatus sottacetonis]|uniref:hypothetical protein n=1 Tax=Pectinatus sottacetonis TaxID=1002795 RepID=UPI0018C537D3|nr:hypothetical protein [Pectinatus sottacetonis]